MVREPEPERLSQTYLRMRHGSVTIGDLLYAKGGSFGPRIQTDFQLVIIHSGRLSLELDAERLEVPENHGVLLRPGHTEHFFLRQTARRIIAGLRSLRMHSLRSCAKSLQLPAGRSHFSDGWPP